MSTWVPSLPLGPAGFPIPTPGLGLLGPLIGGAAPVVANVLGAAIVSELLFPQTVADGTLDGNWRQVWRDWGTENFGPPPPLTFEPIPLASYDNINIVGVSGSWDTQGANNVSGSGSGEQRMWWGGASVPASVAVLDRQLSGATLNLGMGLSSAAQWPNGTVSATGVAAQANGGNIVLVWATSGRGLTTVNTQITSTPLNPDSPGVVPLLDLLGTPQPEFVRDGTRDLAPFTNPGDGAAQVGQVGTGAPALGEQVADAIAGAGVAVAAPPSPQLPGSSPVGLPGGGGGASSSPEAQQVTGTGVAGGSAPLPLAPAPLAPAPLPAPVLPGPSPLAPSTAPALPGTPTEAPPAGAPALPGSQPLDNTGNPVPPTLAPPAATPPGQETTPLGPVGGPAQQPAPTLKGIAAEVGKIEQKVLQLQRELQSPPGTGQLVPPWALPLLEALLSFGDGVNYAIPQPCGVDAEGNPEPPVVITVPGALDQLGVIKNRIDGLAELIAVHKEIKQPVCKAPAIQGQGVTVTFEQTPGG